MRHSNRDPDIGRVFLTYETEFILFIVVLEDSVLPEGWDSSRRMFTVKSELNFISDYLMQHHQKHQMMFEEGPYATWNVKNDRN